MNFSSAGGQITINGNTDRTISDDHTSNNTTTDDNSRTINDNSSGCNFYNGRTNQLTITDQNINPTPYHTYNNHKSRVFQQANQFKETGIEIRAQLRNKEMKERKNIRKQNNNKPVKLDTFNALAYGYAELLNDILYTNDAVKKMDEAYDSLLNSNARLALSHKYNNNNNNNNNNRRCSIKMGINNRLELPHFVSSLFTNPLDIEFCNMAYKMIVKTCDDLPHVICAHIAEFSTGEIVECNNCEIEILVLKSELYSNACSYYYFDPTVNRNTNKNNFDVNAKTNAFCDNCCQNITTCAFKLNNFGDASRRINIICSAAFINDKVNNKCSDCRRGRLLYLNGIGVQINCTNGDYTCCLMDGNSNNKY